MSDGFNVKSSKIVETVSTVQSQQPQGFSLNRQIVEGGIPSRRFRACGPGKVYPPSFIDDLSTLLLLSSFKASKRVRRLFDELSTGKAAALG